MSWLIGFIEGEGCFSVSIRISKKSGKMQIKPVFQIVQNDREILEQIRKYIGVGLVAYCPQKRSYGIWRGYRYTVGAKAELFYLRNRLRESRSEFIGIKQHSFDKWAQVLDIIETGEHWKKENILKITELRETMNVDKKQKYVNVQKILENYNEPTRIPKTHKKWNSEEIELAKANISKTIKEIAVIMDRPYSSVSNMVKKIKKTNGRKNNE